MASNPNLILRIPKELQEDLRTVANELGVKPGEVMRFCLEQSLPTARVSGIFFRPREDQLKQLEAELASRKGLKS